MQAAKEEALKKARETQQQEAQQKEEAALADADKKLNIADMSDDDDVDLDDLWAKVAKHNPNVKGSVPPLD